MVVQCRVIGVETIYTQRTKKTQPVFFICLYLQILVTNKIKKNETNSLRVR